MKALCALFIGFFAVAAGFCAPADSLDRFGGTRAIRGKATGFFHVERQKGGWQLIDPDGNGFWCTGMVMAGRYTDTATINDHIALKKAGFNTVMFYGYMGGKPLMSGEIPYANTINCSHENKIETFGDVYSPAFEEEALRRITWACSTAAKNPFLIGYFTDNELPWSKVWGGGFFDDYLNHPIDSAGHKAAIAFARKRYPAIEAFNKPWATAYKSWDSIGAGNFKPGAGYNKREIAVCRDNFLYEVAKRYFTFVYKAIKSRDPNHMVLGTRFLTGDVPMPVIRAMKGSVDVWTTNCYALRTFPAKTFLEWSDTVGAPFMITEWGYAAIDAPGVEQDLPGAVPRLVETQAQRADLFEWYMKHATAAPNCVGAFWWWHVDAGITSKTRGNFGLFTRKHEPYKILLDRATQVNSRVYDMRLKPAAPRDPVAPLYTVALVKKAPVIDGIVDTSRLDIIIDTSCRYEGFGFDTAHFHGRANLSRDDKNLFLSLRVYDKRLKTYSAAYLKDSTRNSWEIDGMELRLGRYQAEFYFADSQLTYSWVSSDPFPGIVCKGSLLADGYTMEISFPLEQLVDVVINNEIAFAIGLNDGEANKGRYRQLQWPKSFEWIYRESYARTVLAKN
jgi:hypothetical protein